MKLFKLSLAAILLILFHGCDIINPEEQVASYIYLEEIQVEDNGLIAEGSLDNEVFGAQVFVGGEFLGIFTIPATIPVLLDGPQELVIDPVVRQNGLTFLLNIYPFYKRHVDIIDLTAGQVDTIRPVVQYLDEFEIGFIEDFELGGTIFNVERDGNEETFVDVTTDEVFEGNRSGVIRLDTANIFIDVATDEASLFPLGDALDIWMEINVKTDINIVFGLVGYDVAGPVASSFEFGVLAGPEWKKLYFNLGAEVISSGFEDYAIALTTGLPLEDGKFVLEEANVYLDNVKLFYR